MKKMEKSKRVIIMAAGKGSRWGEGSKHLIKINNETLLRRTTRQARKYCKDIYITTNTKDYKTVGAKLYFPNNNNHEIDRFLSNQEIWTKNTIFLYGDVYYTDDTIKKIFETDCDDFHYFGRIKSNEIKSYPELFAIIVKDTERFKEVCEKIKKSNSPYLKRGLGWTTYAFLNDKDPDILPQKLSNWIREHKHTLLTEINDETEDFDSKEDYLKYLGRIPKIIHMIWLGGNFPYQEHLDSWIKYNPGFEVKLWTEKEINKEPIKNKKLLNKLTSYSNKADVLRIELLYLYGGVYVDADAYCKKPIAPLLKSSLISSTNANGIMCPSFMASVKGHKCLKEIIDNYQKQYNKVIKKPVAKIYELACQYFDPIVNKYNDYLQIDKGKRMGTRKLIVCEKEKTDNAYVVQKHANTWRKEIKGRAIRTPSISYNIMAHPRRKEYIPGLKKELGNTKVIWDRYNDVWDTRKRCLQDHLKKGKDFAITIQDDVILAKDFKEKALRFICERAEVAAYNFFYIKNRQPIDELISYKEKGWVKKDIFFNEIAFAIPTSIIPELIEHCDEMKSNSDSNLARFISSKMKTYYILPSIANHRDDIISIYREGKTTKWIEKKERLAWWFDKEESPLKGNPKFGYAKNERGKWVKTIIGYGEEKETK